MNNDIINPDSGGFKNEKFFSVAILILIIIAIGGFAILRSDANLDFNLLKGETTPKAEETEVSNSEDLPEGVEYAQSKDEESNGNLEEEGANAEASSNEENSKTNYVETEKSKAGAYTVEAKSGDGLTHLARRAVKAHGTEDLSAEQKVYVEDYIKDELLSQRGTSQVKLGESVEISEDLIEEAIQESENLTESQLQNLSQYSQTVSF